MKWASWVLLMLTFALQGCTGVFYQPDRKFHFPPSKLSLEPEDLFFPSQDGTRLHAWFFHAVGTSHPKGTIVQFHGNAENISSHYLSLVWLTREGYNLFCIDYRGYGQSEGSPSQRGLYEDGLAALNKAWRLNQANGAGPFIIYGQSLGGAVALRAFGDFPHRKQTALVVMDSTFVSYKDVAEEKVRQILWPLWPLGWLLVSDAYSSEVVAKHLDRPLLVIHDHFDPIVGIANGRKLFDLAPTRKEFWETESGSHVGVFVTDAPQNRRYFLELLKRL